MIYSGFLPSKQSGELNIRLPGLCRFLFQHRFKNQNYEKDNIFNHMGFYNQFTGL